MAATAANLLGGIGGIFGGILGQNQQDWLKNTLISIYNNSQQANQFGIDRALPAYGSLLDAGNNLVNLGTQFSFGAPGSDSGGAFTQLNDDLNSLYQRLNPSQFQGNGLSPQSMQSLGDLYNVAGGMDLSPFQQIIQNGGQTPLSGPLGDRLMDMVNGSGYLGTLGDVGGSLLGNRGQTAFTQGLQDVAGRYVNNGGSTSVLDSATNAANALIGAGGMTSPLTGLLGAGNSILSNGGMTPQIASASNSALNGFNGGGATPFLQQLQQLGLKTAATNPLMPASMQVSFARDQAARNAKDQAQAVMQQAVNRGGGPGAVVANGTTNEAMADFADQATGGISQAIQNALLSAQGLGLQEQGLGAQMGLGAAGTQAGQLGTYGSALSNLMGAANQRLNIGANLSSGAADAGVNALLSSMGLLPAVQNSSTNLMGTAGNLGLGAGQLENSAMGLGGNLLSSLYGIQNNAAGNLNNLIGNQNQYTLGAGSIANQGTGIQGNILNNVLGANISGDQLGLSQANSYQQALQSLLASRGNVAGQGLNLINSGFSPLNSALNFGGQYAMNGLNLQNGLFSHYDPTSPLASGIVGSLGSFGKAINGGH